MKTDSEIINTGFESVFQPWAWSMPSDLSCCSNAISLTIPNGKKTFGQTNSLTLYLRKHRGHGIKIKLPSKTLYDSMIVSAALQSGCTILYSEDM